MELSCKEGQQELNQSGLLPICSYLCLSISDEYQVLDIKISSDGKTEWVSVEVIQPTELCTIFLENRVLFRVARDGTVRSEQSVFSVLMKGARAVADKRSGVSICLYYLNVRQWRMQDF